MRDQVFRDLMAAALDRRSALLARILATRRFGVNVLSSADEELAARFARPGTDRFAGAAWRRAQGLPRPVADMIAACAR